VDTTHNLPVTVSYNVIAVAMTIRVQSERGRKHAEAELNEVSLRINELSVTITNLNNDKRRFEADLANLQAELEEALAARRAAEDRADRAQMELSRLTEELRQVFLVFSVTSSSRFVSNSSHVSFYTHTFSKQIYCCRYRGYAAVYREGCQRTVGLLMTTTFFGSGYFFGNFGWR